MAQTGQPYAYTGDDPVNGVDPLGLSWYNPSWVHKAIHRIARGANKVGRTTAHVASNALTEVKSHWRGLAKIGIVTVTVVAGAACAAATAGVCGAAAFSLGGLEISGGALTIGFASGGAEGAVDYALDPGSHSLGGYLTHAAEGAGEDSLFAGLPEEGIFGGLETGVHSPEEFGFIPALRNLPKYISSVFAGGAHAA